MSAILWAALWALAVNLVAMLPWGRVHFSLGFILLLCFPLVVRLIWLEFGGWAVFAVSLVLISLYRKPLVYFVHKGWGFVRGNHENS